MDPERTLRLGRGEAQRVSQSYTTRPWRSVFPQACTSDW